MFVIVPAVIVVTPAVKIIKTFPEIPAKAVVVFAVIAVIIPALVIVVAVVIVVTSVFIAIGGCWRLLVILTIAILTSLVIVLRLLHLLTLVAIVVSDLALKLLLWRVMRTTAIPLGPFAAGLGDHKIVTTLCPGGKERMRRLMSVIASGRIDLRPMVTHRFKLDQIVHLREERELVQKSGETTTHADKELADLRDKYNKGLEALDASLTPKPPGCGGSHGNDEERLACAIIR